MSVNSKMTAIADEIRTLSGTTEAMGLDVMASTLNSENASFSSNLENQDSLISQIRTALAGKAAAGGTPDISEPVLQSKTVTPGASDKIITADNGYDGLSQVTVEGDSNLIASNIVSGVSIFGVAGSAQTGGSGGGSAGETATVTVVVDAPLAYGGEKLYYTGIDGIASVRLSMFEMDSTAIACTIPSIITINFTGIEFVPSGSITKLESNVYYVTGHGTLYYG